PYRIPRSYARNYPTSRPELYELSLVSARTCPVISSPARCRSRCMPDAASSSRNTSILLSSHVRLGTRQVFHPPATELDYIRTAGGGNAAVLSPLSPPAVPLLLKPRCPAVAIEGLGAILRHSDFAGLQSISRGNLCRRA